MGSQLQPLSFDLHQHEAKLVRRRLEAMIHTPRNALLEVYLNDKRELLVVEKGTPLSHIGTSVKWRRKKGVLKVSDEIRSAVQRQGYYLRKLSGAAKHGPRPNELALSFGHVQSLQHHHQPSLD
jgi:hypothetical protein